MTKPKALFRPTLESNPFYKAAFDADFANATDSRQVKDVFDAELGRLLALIKD